MKIQKVKLSKDGGIFAAWLEFESEKTEKAYDAALPAFDICRNQLLLDAIVNALDLHAWDEHRLIGLTISEDSQGEDRVTATIWAKPPGFDGGTSVNSPCDLLLESPFCDEIEAFLKEVERYMSGDRAQLSLGLSEAVVESQPVGAGES